MSSPPTMRIRTSSSSCNETCTTCRSFSERRGSAICHLPFDSRSPCRTTSATLSRARWPGRMREDHLPLPGVALVIVRMPVAPHTRVLPVIASLEGRRIPQTRGVPEHPDHDGFWFPYQVLQRARLDHAEVVALSDDCRSWGHQEKVIMYSAAAVSISPSTRALSLRRSTRAKFACSG